MDLKERIELIGQLNAEMAYILARPKMKFTFVGEWDARATYGVCERKGDHYTIKISKWLANDEDVRNTMIHELCHLYDENRSGHGESWKKIAAVASNYFHTSITRTDNKKLDAEALNKAVAKYECKNCGTVGYLYRRSKAYTTEMANYYCTKCGPHFGRFNFVKIK